MRRILLTIAILSILLVPMVAQAADWLPLVPCGRADQVPPVPCTPCHLVETFKNLIDLVLYGITGPIAAFMIVWAGGMMLLGGGKPTLYSQGTTLLKNVLIGVTIILLSWVVTNFLITSLITTGEGSTWNEFSCPESLEGITNIETEFPSVSPMPLPKEPASIPVPGGEFVYPAEAAAAVAYAPDALGVACLSSTINTCRTDYKCPGCPQFRNEFLKYPNEAKLLESIMYAESSCRIQSSKAGAHGIMQMLVTTAARHAEACKIYEINEKAQPTPGPYLDKNGKPVVKRITVDWLLNENNIADNICLAAMEIRAISRLCGGEARNIAAGYNSGPGWCKPSRDCPTTPSCSGKPMLAWECPWDNRAHTRCNTGLNETKRYAPKVATCAK